MQLIARAFKMTAAQKFLKRWGVKERFWQAHKEKLIQEGLEIPDWIIILGAKPATQSDR